MILIGTGDEEARVQHTNRFYFVLFVKSNDNETISNSIRRVDAGAACDRHGGADQDDVLQRPGTTNMNGHCSELLD